MSGRASNITALKQWAARLALLAMALIIFAPLISVSLQQSPILCSWLLWEHLDMQEVWI